MAILNRYAGKCAVCGKRVPQQDGVASPDSNGKWQAFHFRCADPGEAIELAQRLASDEDRDVSEHAAKAARAAAWEAEKARVLAAAGLQWDKLSFIEGSLRQHAYSDTSEAWVPFANGDATEKDLSDALRYLDPRSSSYGALRWSQGSTLLEVDRAGRRIRIEQSTGICD